MTGLPLERTDVPGIYRRGAKYVVVYRVEARQRKQYADTLGEARAIKLKRDTRPACSAAAPRCTSSACPGLTVTAARAATVCARTRVANTAGCWSTSR